MNLDQKAETSRNTQRKTIHLKKRKLWPQNPHEFTSVSENTSKLRGERNQRLTAVVNLYETINSVSESWQLKKCELFHKQCVQGFKFGK